MPEVTVSQSTQEWVHESVPDGSGDSQMLLRLLESGCTGVGVPERGKQSGDADEPGSTLTRYLIKPVAAP